MKMWLMGKEMLMGKGFQQGQQGRNKLNRQSSLFFNSDNTFGNTNTSSKGDWNLEKKKDFWILKLKWHEYGWANWIFKS